MRGSVGRAGIVGLLARAGAVLLVVALVAQLLVSAIAVDPVGAATDRGLGSFVVSLLRGTSTGALGAAACVVAVLLLIVAVRGVRLARRLLVRRCQPSGHAGRSQAASATDRASATR
ncbi:hypothetical protein [Streptomyces peucetius]|uniref:Uncharacterized protein n=1 Tax=Streptomyces peucetius TaxID=1950 RepID=A0ABY6I738_STRPE|nr:hypothetical protein [Streptomyces peucetius]UYQ62817.1 hypothetical protein OGH68_15910 [Streptomyces peucetius]